jgi:ABC-2 type transport system permease protein
MAPPAPPPPPALPAFTAALWAELLKARRSPAPWLTALGISLGPLVGALFMMVLRDPAWARRVGLLNAKAQLVSGAADWPGYLSMVQQAVALGGALIFGLTVTWVFGREYADDTAKDLLALPTPREAVVLAKCLVVAGWCLVLAALVAALAFGLGRALALEGGSVALARQAAATIALVAGTTVLLVMPFAWVASATRGYLPTVGAMFLVMFATQVLAALGWGAYFPWAVPALAAGSAGPEAARLGAESYLLVVVTGLAGIAGTAAWWRLADQA